LEISVPVKCEACLKVLSDERLTRDDAVAEGSVVSDRKYEVIDAILGRVHEDLEFRSRLGLALHVKRVRTWFRFHGPWWPGLPSQLDVEVAPKATLDCYKAAIVLCEYLAQKSWADEIHLQACAAQRELVRELARQNVR
jgi:hypothetical protein